MLVNEGKEQEKWEKSSDSLVASSKLLRNPRLLPPNLATVSAAMVPQSICSLVYTNMNVGEFKRDLIAGSKPYIGDPAESDEKGKGGCPKKSKENLPINRYLIETKKMSNFTTAEQKTIDPEDFFGIDILALN